MFSNRQVSSTQLIRALDARSRASDLILADSKRWLPIRGFLRADC